MVIVRLPAQWAFFFPNPIATQGSMRECALASCAALGTSSSSAELSLLGFRLQRPNQRAAFFQILRTTVSETNPIAVLLRRRLPFLPLLILAICAIAISQRAHAPSILWLTGAGLAAATFFATGRAIAFGALTVCVFATLHLWRSGESQAAQFAAWLGARSLPAEARGIVASEPRIFSSGNSSIEVRLSQLRVGETELVPSFVLQVEWPGIPPAYGDEVLLRGTLERIGPPRNPGQFDFAAWSARQDIFTNMRVEHRNDAQILRQNQGNPLVSLALRTRAWLRQTLIEGVNDRTVSDLLVAMVYLATFRPFPSASRKDSVISSAPSSF